jgi:hypothetical protein
VAELVEFLVIQDLGMIRIEHPEKHPDQLIQVVDFDESEELCYINGNRIHEY